MAVTGSIETSHIFHGSTNTGDYSKNIKYIGFLQPNPVPSTIAPPHRSVGVYSSVDYCVTRRDLLKYLVPSTHSRCHTVDSGSGTLVIYGRHLDSGKGLSTTRTLHTDETTEPLQASSTRYLLRVVITSVTIVPKSSRSDSVCWIWEDCPVALLLYEGRGSGPSVSNDGVKASSKFSTFTGINFQIHQGKAFVVSVQTSI